MTEDETITLGLYCENLLLEECFNVVAQQFDRQCFEHFMASEKKEEREEVYAKMRGMQDFLVHLKAYVDQKDDTLKRIDALSNNDAHYEPIEGID